MPEYKDRYVKVRYIQRCKLLKLRFKKRERRTKMDTDQKEMEMETSILKTINRKAGDVTPEMLAKRLKTDVKTIERSLTNLETMGKIRPTSWEKILEMGK